MEGIGESGWRVVAGATVCLLLLSTPATFASTGRRRLATHEQWNVCLVGGEERPAAWCSRPRLVAGSKGRRVPASGTVTLGLDRAGSQAATLQVDAYTYDAAPRRIVPRLSLRVARVLVSRSARWDAFEHAFSGVPEFRRVTPGRVDVPAGASWVRIPFAPEDRGRRALIVVRAWSHADVHPIALDDVVAQPGEHLSLAFGVQDVGWEGDGRPVTFALERDDAPSPLWQRTLDPKRVDADRGWQEADVALPAGVAQRLRLTARIAGTDDAAPFATWAQPALVAPAPTASGPPSILLVSLDTLRADHVGAYGASRKVTPTLDRLAASGVVFEHVLSQFPSTTASHMTMFTSLQPCVHMVTGPGPVLADDIPTLPQVLAAQGYSTVAITEDGLIQGDQGFDRGFDSYRDLTVAPDEPFGRFLNGITLARAWLDRHGDERFFMFLHTYEVHGGEERRSEHYYDVALRYTDDLLGAFFDHLRARGVLDHTLLVVTSDHGTEFGEHGGFGHARGVYREQLQVPLLLSHPAIASGGRRIPEHVTLLDLAPTLVDVAGATAPGTFTGRSLLPAIRGVTSGNEEREVYGEQLWGPRQTRLSIGTRAWIQKPGGVELYDLSTDPLEQHDLAAEASAVAADGAARIAGFRTACTELRSRLGSAARTTGPDLERTRALRALGYVQ